MSLAKLKRVEAQRVLGIDASTNSIAFCIFDGDKPVSYGEVTFDGSDVYERMLDAKQKMSALRKTGMFDVDFIAIEAGIMVRSAHVAIKMAYVFGIIMGELLSDHIDVIEIHPITWQSYIGNTNFTKAQKLAVKEEFPGKSDNWYKAKIRDIRKHKTLQYMADKGIITDNDNVADAAGLAWYAINNLTRANG